MLSAEQLSFAYGGRPVLVDVSLTIEPGSLVGLVGPNGSGKTTLLRCLAGLLRGSGTIRYGGVLLERLSSRARAEQRAFVPQNISVMFPYRVRDVVAMGLAHTTRFYGAPSAAAPVREALAAVGFARPAEQSFRQLSGGERQQVLVARALVQGSAILLLDEPTSALDLRHRAVVVAALRERARRGVAILVSMHDLNLAALACDRLILLDGGRIVAAGGAKQVLARETVERVYGARVVCGRHPSADVPTVELDPQAWQ